MILAVEFSDPFHGCHIFWTFHYAYHIGPPALVGTDGTWILIGQIAAYAAIFHFPLGFCDGICQSLRFCIIQR